MGGTSNSEPGVSSGGQPTAERPRLHLRRNDYSLTDHGKHCPNCNAAMPSDARLCVACGFDTVTGRRIKSRARSATPGLLRHSCTTILILALAAATLYGAWLGAKTYAHRRAAELRADVAARFETEHPRIKEGTAMELALMRGGKLTGRFLGEENGEILFRVSHGEIRLAPDEIAPNVRARLSSSAREQMLSELTQERLSREPLDRLLFRYFPN